MATARAPDPPPPGHERVLTGPLVLFLLALAAIGTYAAWARFATPDVPTAIRALADGDLDREERERALRALVRGAAASAAPAEQWAGLLAAVALDDRAAYGEALGRLGGGLPAPPAPAQRELLHLGDAVLGNLGSAMWAEAGGARGDALARWRQVEAQCRLAPHALAAELAAAGIERLR